MYSKARIAGHAIHPMLVGFPLALFTATIGLELAYIGTQDIFYFRAAMVANIAADLEMDSDAINIKGKTTEKLGFTGRGEGIAAQAVALLARSASS